jgi:hypothetical protein
MTTNKPNKKIMITWKKDFFLKNNVTQFLAN